ILSATDLRKVNGVTLISEDAEPRSTERARFRPLGCLQRTHTCDGLRREPGLGDVGEWGGLYSMALRMIGRKCQEQDGSAHMAHPEDELERLTKKMLFDMDHPPSEEYFGRCASCGDNVVGEGTGCTAMDQVFHVDCFVCMTCSSKLRGKPFYAVEKKAYWSYASVVRSRGLQLAWGVQVPHMLAAVPLQLTVGSACLRSGRAGDIAESPEGSYSAAELNLRQRGRQAGRFLSCREGEGPHCHLVFLKERPEPGLACVSPRPLSLAVSPSTWGPPPPALFANTLSPLTGSLLLNSGELCRTALLFSGERQNPDIRRHIQPSSGKLQRTWVSDRKGMNLTQDQCCEESPHG
ncbi:Lipoma-preferred partner like, partial [Dissostichus eleginoides]